MGGQRILDFESRNVLRVADDRIFDPAGDANIAVLVDQPEIAAAKPAVLSNASASSPASA